MTTIAVPLRDTSTATFIVDDLIRFENLQAGFDAMCERIGTPRRLLPHINRSARERAYRGYFDPRTRRIAEQMFAEDLAVFG